MTWILRLLRCVECQGELSEEAGSHFVCLSCGTIFPCQNTVPFFFPRTAYRDNAALISTSLGGLDIECVERAFASALRYDMNDKTIRGEFRGIVERYVDESSLENNTSELVEQDELQLKAEYFYKRFHINNVQYRSLRVRNNGKHSYATATPFPHHLSYKLIDKNGLVTEGIRSRLPIPLLPGSELTIPVAFFFNKPGRFLIEIYMVEEFVRWHDKPIFSETIDVLADTENFDSIIWNSDNGYFDFLDDINKCGEVYNKAVDYVRLKNAGTINVVEFACGADPQVVRHMADNSNVVACDVSYPQAQICHLSISSGARYSQGAVRVVCCDIYTHPFLQYSFDIVLISAALHHMANLVSALDAMKRLLKPGGVIVLLREPAKVAPDDDVYIKELKAGFNEQQFELCEYREIFSRVGLRPIYEQVDFQCSYKVICTPL